MSQRHRILQPNSAQPRATGYDYLASILDSIDVDELVEALEERRRNGRHGFSQRAMWRAWLTRYVLGIKYATELVKRLQEDERLADVCGFEEGQTPTETAISRFHCRLNEPEYTDLVEQAFNAITEELREELPGLGDEISLDSTAVESFSNPNRKTISDPEAQWGFKHKARAKDPEKTEYFFGYKVHTVADANYDVPLSIIITPGNQSDMTMLPKQVRKAQNTFDWLAPNYAIADKGYDSKTNHEALLKRGVTPIIHIRDMRRDEKSLYTELGKPKCLGMKGMEYVSTDPVTGKHLFRCQKGGCELKEKGTKAIRHCDDEVWIDPYDNIRVVGVVHRASPEWKELYAKRQGIERIFRSTQHSRSLEGHCYRGMEKIRTHALVSMLAYSATVLVRARAGFRKVKDMRVKLAEPLSPMVSLPLAA